VLGRKMQPIRFFVAQVHSKGNHRSGDPVSLQALRRGDADAAHRAAAAAEAQRRRGSLQRPSAAWACASRRGQQALGARADSAALSRMILTNELVKFFNMSTLCVAAVAALFF